MKREHIQRLKNETSVVPQHYQVEKANEPTNKIQNYIIDSTTNGTGIGNGPYINLTLLVVCWLSRKRSGQRMISVFYTITGAKSLGPSDNMFVQAVEDVLGDDSFQLPSPLATVALKAATLLPTEVSCWNSLHWRCSKPDFFQIPPEGENMEVNLAGNGLHNSQQSVTPLQFKRVVFPSASISSSLQTWITAWILIRVVSSTLQWSMITCHKRKLNYAWGTWSPKLMKLWNCRRWW